MILYQYSCNTCGEYEAFRKMCDRETSACPTCNGTGQRVQTPIRFDDVAMGMDPDFPSAYSKWGKAARLRMQGKTNDSNNQKLTVDPTGREQ